MTVAEAGIDDRDHRGLVVLPGALGRGRGSGVAWSIMLEREIVGRFLGKAGHDLFVELRAQGSVPVGRYGGLQPDQQSPPCPTETPLVRSAEVGCFTGVIEDKRSGSSTTDFTAAASGLTLWKLMLTRSLSVTGGAVEFDLTAGGSDAPALPGRCLKLNCDV